MSTTVSDENNDLIIYTLDTSNGTVILTGVTYNGVVYPFSCTIPNTVISIGNNAFQNINISSINIPSSVTSIGEYVFSGCSALTSINIPSSVTSIEQYVFSGCSALTSINIPSSVTSIEQYAFSGCHALTSINIPFSVTSIGDGAFIGCRALTSINIPFSVTSIGDYAFGRCYTLTSINIPFSVTSIGDGAFYECTALTSINIPFSVTSIGNNAFSGCSNLTSVVLPGLNSEGLALLGTDLFSGTNVSQTSLQAMLDQGYTPGTLRDAGFTNVPDTPDTPVPCFNEDSKILCLIDGQEKEVLVQNLYNGVLVKTFYSGYKPVCMIGTSVLYNPGTDERFNDRLFICKKEKYPELNEDLIITGCHSILVDEITPLQREKIIKQMGAIYETENNYRLNAILDERAEPYNCAGKFNIYHIALEHDNYIANYGVYANGLLVETCSKRFLKEMSKMRLL
jgi:hypothetical protein